MRASWFVAAAVSLAASVGASTVSAQDSEPVDAAGALLDRMSHALANASYTATMFHHQGEHVNSMRAFQANIEGTLYQAIEYLDVPATDPVKYFGTPQCAANSAFGNLKPENINSQFYAIAIAGEARVAGRMATRLFIKSEDALRYSHLVDIDNETALPLRYAIISQANKLLERIQIVELVPDHQAAVAAMSQFKALPSQCATKAKDFSGLWQITAPPGYEKVSSEVTGERERHTYSDGLSSFSVYVDDEPQSPTVANRGALNVKVAVRQLASKRYTFTVMGDLPSVTIDRILATVRPLQVESGGH